MTLTLPSASLRGAWGPASPTFYFQFIPAKKTVFLFQSLLLQSLMSSKYIFQTNLSGGPLAGPACNLIFIITNKRQVTPHLIFPTCACMSHAVSIPFPAKEGHAALFICVAGTSRSQIITHAPWCRCFHVNPAQQLLSADKTWACMFPCSQKIGVMSLLTQNGQRCWRNLPHHFKHTLRSCRWAWPKAEGKGVRERQGKRESRGTTPIAMEGRSKERGWVGGLAC